MGTGTHVIVPEMAILTINDEISTIFIVNVPQL